MRILVVEDHAPLVASLFAWFEARGHVLDAAPDGLTGLHLAVTQPYDVVLLDWMLPRLDGPGVLARLREAGIDVPVVMLTARGELPDKIAGFRAGADDYLTKPFDFDELLARLRALIRRSSGAGSNLIEIGEITVDTGGRTISRNHEAVSLTAREYRLVEYLAHHRGSVVSRTELYEHLFDENEDTLSNLLDVHVSNVRKKLGASFISTRRGHGYCIE